MSYIVDLVIKFPIDLHSDFDILDLTHFSQILMKKFFIYQKWKKSEKN